MESTGRRAAWPWSQETYRAALAHTGGTTVTGTHHGRRGGGGGAEARGADGPTWTPPWPRADPSDPFFSLMAQHKIVVEFHEHHGAAFARFWDGLCASILISLPYRSILCFALSCRAFVL